MDVVDGQQRLTSICLYLSIIINTLINNQEKEYERDIADFLFHERTCRLTLNNSTEDLFYHLLKNGTPRNEVTTPHQKRLLYAFEKFTEHIQKQLNDKDLGIEYLKKVFTAITGKLVFTYYAIEEECELGMTFELMNSRGKKLSVLELLKNYLMYWISRNGGDEEKDFLTQTVNTAWSDTYNNIGKSTGNDEQCLRIAWTLYCHHLPKHWNRYDGFKDNKYLPLRDFSIKTREDVKDFLITFTDGLAHISKHYGAVITPSQSNTLCNSELEWLTKIHHTGNIANFLPLMVAARIQQEKGECIKDKYLNLLAALECYAVRVFLFEGNEAMLANQASFVGVRNCLKTKPQLKALLTLFTA